MPLTEKSRAILEPIAKGHSYEQILVQELASQSETPPSRRKINLRVAKSLETRTPVRRVRFPASWRVARIDRDRTPTGASNGDKS